MRKLILALACVGICAVGCKQKTAQQNNQTPIESVAALPICQSCSMPMTEDLYGTNADGTANKEYCKYCYADGEFTTPDITMDSMIAICVPHMVAQGMKAEDARDLLEKTLPHLKRWQSQK